MSGKILLVVMCFAVALAFCPVAAQRNSQEDKRKEDAKALLKVARKGLAWVEEPGVGSREAYSGVFTWSKRVLDAELYLSAKADERIAAREKYLARVRKLEGIAKDLFTREIIFEGELLEAEYHRREAELKLDLERDAKAHPRDRQ